MIMVRPPLWLRSCRDKPKPWLLYLAHCYIHEQMLFVLTPTPNLTLTLIGWSTKELGSVYRDLELILRMIDTEERARVARVLELADQGMEAVLEKRRVMLGVPE